jgi:hypothetical protein
MMHTLTVLSMALFVGASVLGQGVDLRLDFGHSAIVPAPVPQFWNSIHVGNYGQTLALNGTDGLPSGVSLTFASGSRFVGTGTLGTTTPVPGSPMALTGFPVEALQDYLYGDDSVPLTRFRLSGLAPGGSYELLFVASRLGVGNLRQTSYTVVGANTQQVLLEPANNERDVAVVPDAVPDAFGTLTVDVQKGPANTNSTGLFYLGAMSITGPPPPLTFLTFTPAELVCSRVLGRGPFAIATQLAASQGETAAAIDAIDESTGVAPTWLSWPTQAQSGTALSMTVDGSALPIGSYSALLTAAAAGYAGATARVALTVRPDDGRLNLLFYGNSYSIGNGEVDRAVADLAEAAGHTRPTTVSRFWGGTYMFYHLTEPHHAAAITTALPLGEEWDRVVLQGMSIESTTTLGNPTEMAQHAGAIVQNVRAHSPNARAVLFQTWARAPWSPFYPGTFAGPLAMHDETRAGYEQARQHIDSLFGPGTAAIARVGEVFMLKGFDPLLYEPDGNHHLPIGTLAAAMTLTTAIYGHLVCNVVPTFGGTSALEERLTGWGLGAAEWNDIATLADRAAHPSLRPWPGSDDDLLLRSTAPSTPPPCSIKTIALGDIATLHVSSPAGTFGGAFACLAVQLKAIGTPGFAWPGHPEVHLDPSALAIYGVSVLDPQGILVTIPVTVSWPGARLLFQGVALAPSPRTGNPEFVTTDGHELRW